MREEQREVPGYEGVLNLGPVMRELEGLLPGRYPHLGCGQFCGLATRFINFRRPTIYRPGQRCDGLQRAGGDGSQDCFPTAWWFVSSAMVVS